MSLGGKINIQEGKVLYDNESGTTGTLSLFESCENFNRIIIFAKLISAGTTYYTSTIVDNPNNKEVAISATLGMSGGQDILIGTVLKTFNGTAVLTRRNYTFSGSSTSSIASNEMWVYKIIGLDRRI